MDDYEQDLQEDAISLLNFLYRWNESAYVIEVLTTALDIAMEGEKAVEEAMQETSH